MRITHTHPRAPFALIKLNNRRINCIAADDEEGWVEIVDISAMAPLDLSSDLSASNDDKNLLATKPKIKRLEGSVTIEFIDND